MATAEITKNQEFFEEASAGSGLAEKFGAAFSLCAAGYAAYELQRRGYTKELPVVAKQTAESLAHPWLGYVSGWIGSTLAARFFQGSKEKALALGLAGTVAADASTEILQNIRAYDQYTNFLAMNKIPETGKDLVFALGGFALYVWHNRRQTSPKGL